VAVIVGDGGGAARERARWRWRCRRGCRRGCRWRWRRGRRQSGRGRTIVTAAARAQQQRECPHAAEKASPRCVGRWRWIGLFMVFSSSVHGRSFSSGCIASAWLCVTGEHHVDAHPGEVLCRGAVYAPATAKGSNRCRCRAAASALSVVKSSETTPPRLPAGKPSARVDTLRTVCRSPPPRVPTSRDADRSRCSCARRSGYSVP
jgi:hypothetical protein